MTPLLLLYRYYLNGVDAFRLKLLLPLTQQRQDEMAAEELKQLSLSNGTHDSSVPSGDIGSKQGQSLHQQHQEGEHETKSADSGQGRQGSPSDEANDLLQRIDALRT